MPLRNCSRCGGNLFLEQLPGEADLVCLQCGFRHTLARQAAVRPR
jgi:DNA-directed RNA polymerase subunit RPC12/RpoP